MCGPHTPGLQSYFAQVLFDLALACLFVLSDLAVQMVGECLASTSVLTRPIFGGVGSGQ